MNTKCVLGIQSEWSDRHTDEGGKSDQVGGNVATSKKQATLSFFEIPTRMVTQGFEPGSLNQDSFDWVITAASSQRIAFLRGEVVGNESDGSVAHQHMRAADVLERGPRPAQAAHKTHV